VIVLTSSDAEQDRNAMAELGVTRYLRKPLDLDEFMSIGRVIEDVLREYERA
jgi:DNA-binding response OmpR family regulator